MNFFKRVFRQNKDSADSEPGGQQIDQVTDELKASVRTFIPFNELSENGFNKAMEIAGFKKIPAGETVFRAGDTDNTTVYLVDGSLELVSADNKKKTVASDQPSAFYPVSNLKPRRFTATARQDSMIVEFPTVELDRIVHWSHVAMMDNGGGIEVHDTTETDNQLSWIYYLTNSPSISRLPPSNIERLFKAFTAMDVASGQTVISQGETGECYYLVAEGSCDVTRQHEDGSIENVVSLGAGDAFGEEALLSDLPRNATVTMSSDGQLMCLSKNDFNTLLKEKILNWVDPADAMKEDYCLLDVRSESEFNRDGLSGSLNLPLQGLRKKHDGLDTSRKYLVYCDNGSRSASAAYLLADRGFDVSIIAGGLAAFAEQEDQRLTRPAIPANLEKVLTKEQLATIKKTESSGGGLWFIRRPLFEDVIPVVRVAGGDDARTAIVDTDGRLIQDHDINIRD